MARNFGIPRRKNRIAYGMIAANQGIGRGGLEPKGPDLGNRLLVLIWLFLFCLGVVGALSI